MRGVRPALRRTVVARIVQDCGDYGMGEREKKLDLISKLRGELAAGSPEETGSHFFFFFLFRRKGAEFDSGEESDFD